MQFVTPDVCDECDSLNVVFRDGQPEGDRIKYAVHCRDCGAKWEEYELREVDHDDEGED